MGTGRVKALASVQNLSDRACLSSRFEELKDFEVRALRRNFFDEVQNQILGADRFLDRTVTLTMIVGGTSTFSATPSAQTNLRLDEVR